MAGADARIMEMVRKELEKDRSVATEDLFEKAKKIDADVAKLSARQFHAKYPLQIKRAMKGGRRRTGKAAGRKRATGKRSGTKKATAKKAASPAPVKRGRRRTAGKQAAAPGGQRAAASGDGGGNRRDVRGLLLAFAKQVAQADDKAEMVDVLAGLDGWVERLVAAVGR